MATTIIPVLFLSFIGGCFFAMLYLTVEIALDPDGEGNTWVIFPALKRFIGRR